MCQLNSEQRERNTTPFKIRTSKVSQSCSSRCGSASLEERNASAAVTADVPLVKRRGGGAIVATMVVFGWKLQATMERQ